MGIEVIGQRLLTGRMVIAQMTVDSVRLLLKNVRLYAQQRRVWSPVSSTTAPQLHCTMTAPQPHHNRTALHHDCTALRPHHNRTATAPQLHCTTTAPQPQVHSLRPMCTAPLCCAISSSSTHTCERNSWVI